MWTSTLLIAASATTVLGASLPPVTSTPTDLSSCAAQMDGKLPYYQPQGFNFSGTIRRYYVAAEIETWNYAPSGKPSLPKKPFTSTDIVDEESRLG
jgi:hypothetical protein